MAIDARARRPWESFAADPADSDDDRTLKTAALLVAGASCVAGVVWTTVYLLVFGWGLTAAMPLLFDVVVGSAMVVSHRRRDHRPAVVAQIACIMVITAVIQWSIGGIFDSGFVVAWAFLGPITALVFFSFRHAMAAFVAYVALLLVTIGMDASLSDGAQELSRGARLWFTAMNLGVASLVVFAFAAYFVTQAVAERERANGLLLNVLPRSIAPVLKRSSDVIASHHDDASVLFADLVGSTPLFADLAPSDAVDWLNEVFSAFDELVERRGLEKVRTIGDNYMVAAGAPEAREDHAREIVLLGLEMLDALEGLAPRHGQRLQFRIGVNTGPLVGGVIGTSKFHYDVWGDTVNVASRMESHGAPGRVHVSQTTYERLGPGFRCEERGHIEVKGRGAMATWFVLDGPEEP